MKAILKSDRRIIDVTFIGATSKTKFYKDKEGQLYVEEMIEIFEYYGG